MYISTNILKEYVDLDGIDLEEAIDKFSLSTAEVEGITEKGKDIIGVVVGKVVSCEKVDGSDKLHKVEVDIGGTVVKSVCGAPNMRIGLVIPFAKVGSTVLSKKVEKGILLGQESNGVCLSEKELGISDDHSGVMELDENLKLGTDIKKIFEIEDTLFEVDNKSLTNRPDLWGHVGIAREFSAILRRPLKTLSIDDLNKYETLPKLNIKIEAKDKCLRYTGIAVENITKKQVPKNMQIRLYYLGMRSINLLTDLTNYCMLELGQPMHAFDKEKVDRVKIKTFNTPKQFVTLDSESREIPENTLCICKDDMPICVAGIMGGLNTEITENTNSLFLESATFDATTIRKSAIKLGLRTEASARYEKTLDPENAKLATARYLKLLKDIDENIQVVSSYTDEYVYKYPVIKIDVSKKYIDSKIGAEIPYSRIKEILLSLGFEIINESTDESFTVVVPSFRATKDVSMKADIVEEVARIFGYSNIVPQKTSWPLEIVEVPESRKMDLKIKDLLVMKYSLNEVHSYIWYDNKKLKEIGVETKDNVKIINSLTSENSILRDSMIPTMITALDKNIKNYNETKIFEIGKVFKFNENKKDVIETKNLGIIIESKLLKDNELVNNSMDIIRDILYITKNIKEIDIEKLSEEELESNYLSTINSCKVVVNGIKIATVSLLNEKTKDNNYKKSSIATIEIYLDDLLALNNVSCEFEEVSKYQTVNLDLSLLVDKNLEYKYIKNIINNSKIQYLKSYEIIDIFENEKLKDKKSITIRFLLSSNEKTLTGEEINEILNLLISAFEDSEYNIEVRKS